MKYSEQDMATLIREVEETFREHLAKAEQQQTDLAKSEAATETQEVAKTEEVVAPEAVTTEVAKTEEVVVAEVKAEEVVEKSEALDYTDEEIQEIRGLYKSMTKVEAMAHLDALKKALFGEEKEEEKEESKEDEKKEDEKKDKKEDEKKDEIKEVEMKKSEVIESDLLKSEIESTKKENEDLKKNLENLTAAFTKFVKTNAPKQKAITKIEYIKKSEMDGVRGVDAAQLTSKEIAKKLTDKMNSGKLEKADFDAINDYYLNGSKSLDLIKHLL